MISAADNSKIWKRMRKLLHDADTLGPFNPDYAEAFGMAMALYLLDGTDYPPSSTSRFHEEVRNERIEREEKKRMCESILIS